METIDKIVQRVLAKRQSRQMSAPEFAEFIRELEAGSVTSFHSDVSSFHSHSHTYTIRARAVRGIAHV